MIYNKTQRQYYYVKLINTGKYVDEVNGVYYYDSTPRRRFLWSETIQLKQKFPNVGFEIIPIG